MTTTTPQATTPAPTTALKPKDTKSERRLTIRVLFDQQRPELIKLLPKGMSLDRLYRIALTECTKNPKLLECTAESWALALQTCAGQGLYPDSGLGFMYLIPRNNSKKGANGTWSKAMEVTAQRGYQGDIQLARNSGELADIYAEVVYEKDQFKVRKGLDRTIEHEPYMGDEDPGKLVATYAVAKLKSGETAWVVLTKRDVERHKLSAFKADEADSPWMKHTAAMWRKTAIHELSKWLPKSSENMELLARGDEPTTEAAIDISAQTLPIATPRPLLEEVKDGLRGQMAEPEPEDESEAESDTTEAEPDAPGCAHPKVPPSTLAGGKVVPCPDCGEELREEGAATEPDQSIAEEAKKFAEATAQKAETKGKARQSQARLTEEGQ